jgi:hypothetical protein
MNKLKFDYPDLQPSVISNLADALVSTFDSVINHLKSACISYFKFMKDVCNYYEQDSSLVALRLLKLLIDFEPFMSTEFAVGFNSVPTAPWKPIIPQLFSHLNHPNTSTRNILSRLLCNVAIDSPQ